MAANAAFRGPYVTIQKSLTLGIWPWTHGVRSRLPRHYKKRYCEKFMIKPKPVHYKPDTRKYTVDEFGVRTRVVDRPIMPVYPEEADQGLWGGEGIIDAYKKSTKNAYKPILPYLWKPRLWKRVLYSEILDKHMEIMVTPRTLDLIDEAFGFDHYILKTHEVDLCSKLGMALRRDMLLALVRKTLYPNNPQKCEEIYERYKQYIIPEEEVPWLGLTLVEADVKQTKLEEEERLKQRPLKETYMQDLVSKLKDNQLEEYESSKESESWLSKMNPFVVADKKETGKTDKS